MKEVKKYDKYYLEGVDGKQYEVSEEIFREYKRAVWRENSQIKREYSVVRDKNETISELDKQEYVRVSSVDSIVAGGGEHHIKDSSSLNGYYLDDFKETLDFTEYFSRDFIEDFTEVIADVHEKIELLNLLRQALEILNEQEKEMIERLFYDNISEREYERKYGVKRKTVAYRKGKILSKLRDFINRRASYLT